MKKLFKKAFKKKDDKKNTGIELKDYGDKAQSPRKARKSVQDWHTNLKLDIANSFPDFKDIHQDKKMFSNEFIKNLLLQGKMNSDFRREFWLEKSGALREKNNNENYYNSLVNDIPGDIPSTYDNVIIADLPRTFPHNKFFQKEENIQKLHRILLSYSKRNALVGYCQGFNFMAGRLLQIMGNEVILNYLFFRKMHFGYSLK